MPVAAPKMHSYLVADALGIIYNETPAIRRREADQIIDSLVDPFRELDAKDRLEQAATWLERNHPIYSTYPSPQLAHR